MHGTGRAVDYFPESREKGDQALATVRGYAAQWGVQYVIWYRQDWSCGDAAMGSYGGPNPHTDHLHIEVTVAASGATGRAAPPGTDPGDTPGAGPGSGDSSIGLGDAVGIILDPNTWRRAGFILAGVLVFLLGVALVAQETGTSVPLPANLRKVASAL